MLMAAGCLPEKVGGVEPRLKVGVLSDIHLLVQKDSMHSDVYFEKALRWYDEQKADAVLLCGDIADCGLVSELEYAAAIWNRVFPGDRRSDGEPIKLSALEFRLLTVFLNHRGKLLTRAKLLEDIWDIAGDFVNDNTLTVYIKRLREKLGDDGSEPQIIKTVRGLGYRMD